MLIHGRVKNWIRKRTEKLVYECIGRGLFVELRAVELLLDANIMMDSHFSFIGVCVCVYCRCSASVCFVIRYSFLFVFKLNLYSVDFSFIRIYLYRDFFFFFFSKHDIVDFALMAIVL